MNLGNPSFVNASLKNRSGKLSFEEWLRTYGTLSGCSFKNCLLISESLLRCSSVWCLPFQEGITSPLWILRLNVSPRFRTLGSVSDVSPLFQGCPLGRGWHSLECWDSFRLEENSNPQSVHFHGIPWGCLTILFIVLPLVYRRCFGQRHFYLQLYEELPLKLCWPEPW